MAGYLLIAVGAGLASIALFLVSAVSLAAGVICFLITPLPLFLVGLSQGAVSALIAGVTAAAVGALYHPGFGFNFLAIYAVPVFVLCRQALLWRQDADGSQAWYPLGRLATVLAGMTSLYTVVIFAASAVFADGVLVEMERALTDSARLMGLPDEHLPQVAALAADIPWKLAVVAMLLLTFNGALAQGLLSRFGRNVRPKADIAGLRLPPVMLAALLVSAAACFLPDTLGIMGKTLAAIVAVTYFLAGLGVIHAWVRNWSARDFILSLIYVAAFLLIWPAIVGIGLWSQIQGLRRGGADRSEE